MQPKAKETAAKAAVSLCFYPKKPVPVAAGVNDAPAPAQKAGPGHLLGPELGDLRPEVAHLGQEGEVVPLFHGVPRLHIPAPVHLLHGEAVGFVRLQGRQGIA